VAGFGFNSGWISFKLAAATKRAIEQNKTCGIFRP
jgi:hypothetical protein